ncbi:hypothetical protein JCM3765_000797 [Sporobolomyces pararoseus]
MCSLTYQDARNITLDNIHRLRELALLSPLRRGNSLEWVGPTHVPASLPPDNHSSRSECRPIHTTLLSEDGPAKSSEPGWMLKLVEPLQAGLNAEGQWGQVWRASVIDEKGRRTLEGRTVVVKLYQESLFPDPLGEDEPEIDGWSRYTAAQLEERESRVYSQARALQGRDIPLSYGFYTFALPSGEKVHGVVLEDLIETAEPLTDFVDWLRRNNELTIDVIHELTREICERIVSSTPSLCDEYPTHHHSNLWLSFDHFAMFAELSEAIGEEFKEWIKREKEENRLGLVMDKWFYTPLP